MAAGLLTVHRSKNEVHGQQYMERVALDKRSCQHGVIYARRASESDEKHTLGLSNQFYELGEN